MKSRVTAVGLAALISVLALPAQAQTEAEQKKLAELERICEAAREKKLAPMRAERIERCIKEDKRTRESCTEEFANLGNTQKVSTGVRPGLFYDLPECVAAEEARQRYRR